MTMPRATEHLKVSVTSGRSKEPLRDATLWLMCKNPPSTTLGDQQPTEEGSYIFASAVPVIDDDCELEVEKDFFITQTLPIKGDSEDGEGVQE